MRRNFKKEIDELYLDYIDMYVSQYAVNEKHVCEMWDDLIEMRDNMLDILKVAYRGNCTDTLEVLMDYKVPVDKNWKLYYLGVIKLAATIRSDAQHLLEVVR